MANPAIATVATVIGIVYVRNEDGSLQLDADGNPRKLQPGDVLREGQSVVTVDGGRIDLTLADGQILALQDVPETLLTPDLIADTAATPEESALEDDTADKVLAALESDTDLGEALEAPGAGGAEGDNGHGFIRVARIVEETSEFSGLFPDQGPEGPIFEDEEGSVPVEAVDDMAETPADTPVVIDIEQNDNFNDGQIITGVTQPENGTVVINPDDTVTYTPDEGFTGKDTFTYTGTAPDGINQDTATVMVIVGEPEPPEPPAITISIGDDEVIEGTTAQVPVTLSGPSDETITVNFQTADGTATVVGGDYDPASGQVVFAPGETLQIVLVQTNSDDIIEGEEQFTVSLSDPTNAEIADGEGVVTILDGTLPPVLPTLSIGDDVVVEGGTAEVTVTLSGASTEAVSVNFATAETFPVSAISGADYNPETGLITFAPGDTTATIQISTIDDDIAEGTEQFLVNLSSPSNATIADGGGVVSIVDNDQPPPPPPPPPVNNLPNANNDSASTSEDTAVTTGNVLLNDSLGDTPTSITAFDTSSTNGGTVVDNGNGTFTYTPPTGFTGTDTFTYTIADVDGDTDTATVTITVFDDPIITDLNPQAEGGDVSVDEDDLADGSSPNAAALTQPGDFTISAPAGVDDLTVAGQNVIVNGVFTPTSFATPLGNTLEFTAYNPGTGVVSYEYTLNDNETHTGSGQDSLFENLAVVLTDTNNVAANDTLSINIVDDVATANADTDSAVAGATATGNVVTGVDIAVGNDANATDGVADTAGADGFGSPVVVGVATTNTEVTDGSGVDEVLGLAGSQGTLFLKSDGDYEYVANADAAGSDTFYYTIVDGDGDFDTTSLTINLDSDPTITGLTDPAQTTDPDVTVEEDDLPLGSDPTKESLTQPDPGPGTFTISAPDGVAQLTITGPAGSGPAIDLFDAAGAYVGAGQTIDTPLGLLTIGTYTGSTGGTGGVVNYTYTLQDPETNAPGETSVDENFALALTDDDGDVANGQLRARIVDDAPIANADTDSTMAGATATGNVVTGVDIAVGNDANATDGVADTAGADGFGSPVVVGVATTNTEVTDGSGVDEVLGLAGSQGTLFLKSDGDYEYVANADAAGSDTFYYTIVDGDGDFDTTSLTINLDSDPTITGLTDPAQTTDPDVTVEEDDLPLGSDPTKESLTQPDPGPGTFTISAPDGVAQLTITGPAGSGPAIDLFDAAGAYVGAGQTIDTPLGLLTIGTYTGSTGGTGGVVNYTYTLQDPETNAPGETSVDENFALALTDDDGDVANGQLRARIVDDAPIANADTDSTMAGATATGNVVTGVDIAVGNDANATDGVADTAGADGFGSPVVVGVATTNTEVTDGSGVDEVLGLAGSQGTLFLKSDGDYEYVANADAAGSDTFYYTIVDGDGDFDTTSLTINLDSDPTITGLTDPAQTTDPDVTVEEDDLPLGSDPTKESLTQPDPGPGTFTISAPDGVAQLTITGPAGSGPAIDLFDAAGAYVGAGQTIDTPLGLLTIGTYTGSTGGTGGVVNYTYTLQDPETNAPGETSVDENFALALTDDDGDVANGQLRARIVDDAPIANADTDSTMAGATATGNVVTGVDIAVGNDANATDGVADTAGADGFGSPVVVGVATTNTEVTDGSGVDEVLGLAGSQGTLFLKSDGDYEYVANADAAGSDTFYYTIVDGDGDFDTTSLTINLDSDPTITGLTDPAQTTDPDVTVEEDDLPLGSDPTKESLTQPDPGPGTFTISAPDGVAQLTITGPAGSGPAIDLFDAAGAYVGAGQTIDTPLGLLTIGTYTGSTGGTGGVVNYTYTLQDPETNAPGETSVDENFALALTDDDGDVANGQLRARIVDDAPIANADTDSTMAGATATGNVVTGVDIAVGNDANATDGVADTAGADGFGSPVVVGVATTNTEVTDGSGVDEVLGLAGSQGTLFLKSDGDYEYVANADAAGSDTFYYTIVDGDGDFDTTSLTINLDSDPTITGLTDPAQTTDPDVTVEEDDLPLGSDPTKESLTQPDPGPGTFTISAPDGVAQLTITGPAGSGPAIDLFDAAGAYVGAGQTIDTPLGLLTIGTYTGSTGGTGGVVNYTYTLQDPETNAPGETSVDENFALALTDDDGDVANGQLRARIVDDAPIANADTDSTMAGATATGNVVTGVDIAVGNDANATDGVADTAGADGFGSPVVVGVATTNTEVTDGSGVDEVLGLAGSQGTLFLKSDGDYEYVANADAAGSDTFYYTIVDGDGDFDTTSLTINLDSDPTITGLTDPAQTTDPDVTVEEDDLPLGSDPTKESLTQPDPGPGTFTISAPDGVAQLTITGPAGSGPAIDLFDAAGAYVGAGQTIDTPLGLLTIGTYTGSTGGTGGVVNYTYTLQDPETNAPGETSVDENFALALTDDDGDVANGQLRARIVDDAPIANADTDSTMAGATATGNVVTGVDIAVGNDANATDGVADTAGADGFGSPVVVGVATTNTEVTDGSGVDEVLGLAGSQGTLFLKSDGDYEYVANADAAGSDTFYYTIVDGDGDFDTTSLTINLDSDPTITGLTDPAQTTDPDVTVEEDDLPLGSDPTKESLTQPDPGPGTFTISAPDGVAQLTITGPAGSGPAIDLFDAAGAYVGAGQTIDTPLGLLTIGTYTGSTGGTGGVVNYTYTLQDPETNAPGETSVDENFALALTDDDGDVANGQLRARIVDDAPIANADTDSTMAGATATGNVVTGVDIAVGNDANATDGVADTAGADGFGSPVVVGVATTNTEVTDGSGVDEVLGLAGSQGTLFLKSDGDYEYVANADAAGSDTFYYTIVDGDGDFDTTSLTINLDSDPTITGLTDPAQTTDPDVTVEEDDLPLGSDPTKESLTQPDPGPGTFTISAPDGVAQLTITGPAGSGPAIDLFDAAGAYVGAGQTIDTPLGLLTIGTYTGSTGGTGGVVNYTYTLQDPETNAPGETSVDENFALALTDDDGDVANGQLRARIVDDAPIANADTDSTMAGATATGNVVTGVDIAVGNDANATDGVADTAGADGFGSPVVVGVATTNTEVTDGSGVDEVLGLAGSQGTLFLKSDGDYEYVANADAAGSDTFYYTIVDGDGDFDTTSLTINLDSDPTITGLTDPAQTTDPDVTVEEDDLPLGSDPTKESLTQPDPGPGTFTISAPDGVAQLTITGPAGSGPAIDLFDAAGAYVGAGQTIDTPLGLLTIGTYTGSTGGTGGVVNYTYTLQDPETNAPGETSVDENFALALTDDDGDVANGQLRARIVDDAPIANADTDSTMAGATATGNVVTGVDIAVGNDANATDGVADTAGADGFGSPVVVGVATTNTEVTDGSGVDEVLGLAGSQGTLFLKSDGDYEYVANADAAGSDTFYYTIVDGDGDFDTTSLTINLDSDPTITGLTDPAQTTDPDVTVEEDDLPLGSDPTKESLTQPDPGPGTFTISAPDGVAQLTITGPAGSGPAIDLFDAAGAYVGAGQTIDTPLGLLTIGTYTGSTGGTGGVVNYTYTLQDPETNAPGETSVDENFALALTDDDGDVANGQLRARIVDDAPIANADTDSTMAGATATGNVVTGVDIAVGNDANATDGVADTAGADGFGSPVVVGVATTNTEVTDGSGVDEVLGLAGSQGTLFLKSDGDYEYVANADAAGSDTFYYTIVDGDGDFDTTSLTINLDSDPTITGLTDPAQTTDPDVTVEEDDLPLGSDPTKESLTQPDPGPGTFTISAPDGVAQLTITGPAGSGPAIDLFDAAGAYVGAGQTIDTPLGLLTIGTYTGSTGGTGGVVNYTYTLQDPETNAPGETSVDENFALALTDDDGDVANGQLRARIVDDAPIANADTDSTMAGATATGNVVTGVDIAVGNDANATDGVADTAGADGFGSPVVVGVATTNTEVTDGSGVDEVLGLAGSQGTLFLKSDGDYEYVANADAAGSDTFYYTIVDGDGDFDTTSLTINLDSDPTITGLTDPAQTTDPDVTVEEDDLPLGSDPTKESLTQPDPGPGTFTISAPDGVAQLTITGPAGSGPAIDLFDAAGAYVGAGQTIDTPLGLLTIGTYTGSTGGTGGVVNYTYTLQDPETNAPGETSVDENFALALTDDDGDVANGQLRARIVDDAPIANADTDSTMAGATATGNVVTGVDIAVGNDANATDGVADTAGADGFGSPVVVGVATTNTEVTDGSGVDEVLGLAGSQGTLFLKSDGDYEYVANADAAGSDTFYYTIVDGDGDFDTTSLTINLDSDPTITGLTDPAQTTDPDVTVEEDDLPLGSDPTKESLTQPDPGPGTFTISAPDGVAQLTITGPAGSGPAIDLFDAAGAYVGAGQTIDTPLGLLTIGTYTGSTGGTGGVVNYTYTLQDPETNAPGETSVDENFALALTDDDGDVANGQLRARIVDDAPIANADTDSVAKTVGATATGNVVTGIDVPAVPAPPGPPDANATDGVEDVLGADGAGSPVVVGVATTDTEVTNGAGVGGLAGSRGTLTLNSDGSYSYVPNLLAAGAGTDTFWYTIVDGDGDYSTTSLTIDVTPFSAPPEATIDLNYAGSTLPETRGGSITVGTTGDSVIGGSPDVEYLEEGKLEFNLGQEYANESILIEFDVAISGSWNRDGISDPFPNPTTILDDDGLPFDISGFDQPDDTVNDDFMDDWWNLTVEDSAAIPNRTELARFFYNANAATDGRVFDDATESDLSQVPARVEVVTYGDVEAGLNDDVGTPGSPFTHTQQVTVPLDSTGFARLIVGGFTTEPIELATISNVRILNQTDFDIFTVKITADAEPGDALTVVNITGGDATYDLSADSIIVGGGGTAGPLTGSAGNWSITLSGPATTVDALLELRVPAGSGVPVELGVTATAVDGASTPATSVLVTDSATILDATPDADNLVGTADNDVFVWELGDSDNPGSPADTVAQFSIPTLPTDDVDALYLSDLLQGEDGNASLPDSAALENYLNFTSDGTDTLVEISLDGGFTGGVYNPAEVDQEITLLGVDLGSDNAAAIALLQANNQIITD